MISAGLRRRLLDIRHAVASFAISAGANVKAVKRMLGVQGVDDARRLRRPQQLWPSAALRVTCLHVYPDARELHRAEMSGAKGTRTPLPKRVELCKRVNVVRETTRTHAK
jgi:hypothetical protein